MSYADEYADLQSGAWANINPDKCPCRGQGFLFSDLDTTHRCPKHGGGVPHPSEYDVEEGPVPAFDHDAHLLEMRRRAWATFRQKSGMAEANFRSRVIAYLGRTPETPEAWVAVAQEVVTDVEHARRYPTRSKPPAGGRW